MDTEQNKRLGEVRVKKDVIFAIVLSAIKGIKGVRLVSRGFKEGIKRVLLNKDFYKGIKVEIKNNSVKIYLSVVIDYGFSIQEKSEKMQKSIKEEVEYMSGLTVRKVNIIIRDLSYK